MTEKLPRYNCKRCGHKWVPRLNGHPTVCPKCKSPYWDKKRKLPKTYWNKPEVAKVVKDWGVSKEVAMKAIKHNVSPAVICPKCLKFLATPAKEPDAERCTCDEEK